MTVGEFLNYCRKITIEVPVQKEKGVKKKKGSKHLFNKIIYCILKKCQDH
jgi:hypothetical protein